MQRLSPHLTINNGTASLVNWTIIGDCLCAFQTHLANYLCHLQRFIGAIHFALVMIALNALKGLEATLRLQEDERDEDDYYPCSVESVGQWSPSLTDEDDYQLADRSHPDSGWKRLLSNWQTRKGPLISKTVIPLIGLLSILGWLVYHQHHHHSSLPSISEAIDLLDPLVSFSAHLRPKPSSTCQSPFEEPGYLNLDRDHIIGNNWNPFDRGCLPSDLITPLIADLQSSRGQIGDRGDRPARSLDWMVNSTVILIGDSIDRFHLRDFCDLISTSVDPSFGPISENGFTPSPSNGSSPTRSYFIKHSDTLLKSSTRDVRQVPDDWPKDAHQDYLDHHREWSERDNIRTSPWVCEIPRYGFKMVSLFTYGLDPFQSGYHFSKEDWYIPPASFIARIREILIPILTNLNSSDPSGHHLKPDLIEISSGFWDLRQWSEEDSRRLNLKLQDTEAFYFDKPLSHDRLDWWRTRWMNMVRFVDEMFPDPEVKIMWRALHHPRRHVLAPYNRVEQLSQFTKSLIQEVKTQKRSSRLADRLHFNRWGEMILGYENNFRDDLHPKAIPANVLWSQKILWELKESIQRKRSSKSKKSHERL